MTYFWVFLAKLFHIEKEIYNIKTYLNVERDDEHVQKAERVTLQWIKPWSSQKQMPLPQKIIRFYQKKLFMIRNFRPPQKVLTYLHFKITQILIFANYLQQVGRERTVGNPGKHHREVHNLAQRLLDTIGLTEWVTSSLNRSHILHTYSHKCVFFVLSFNNPEWKSHKVFFILCCYNINFISANNSS